MPIEIEMPKLSDTMTDGDVLAEVETDKATMEMEAFDDGVLTEIYVKDGEKVLIGQKLALLSEKDEKSGSTATKPAQAKETTREQAGKPEAPAEEPAATTKAPDGETEPSNERATDDSQRDTLEPA